MERIKRFLTKNPRIKRAYVCKNCRSEVFFTTITDMEAHMRTVHGRETNGALVILECTQMDRATFMGLVPG